MKTYGIVCNALTLSVRTGVERYVSALLNAMMQESLAPGDRVLLYVAKMPDVALSLPTGWEWRVLSTPLPGWTHTRLSLEMFRHPPDVLFVPAHEVPLYVDKKTRVVTTVHDVAFRLFPQAYDRLAVQRQEFAIRHALRHAAQLITVSATTKRDLVELFGVAPERITAIPLAIEATERVAEETKREVLTRYGLANKKYFYLIGRLEEKKNVAMLVRAFADFRRQHGGDVELVLAGKYGYGEMRIRRAISASPEGIHVLGFVPDADAAVLMQGALALCFPSLYEGFGLPILEAFAAGVPVLASDIPSSREVADSAALFVAADDMVGFASAMGRLAGDDALRQELIARGSTRREDFSWSKAAQATWQVLRQ